MCQDFLTYFGSARALNSVFHSLASSVARIFVWKQLEGTDGFIGVMGRTVRVREQWEKGYGMLFYSSKHLTLVQGRTYLLI